MKILLDFSTAASDEYLFNYSFFECIIKPLRSSEIDIYVILSSELYSKIKNINLYSEINFLPLDLEEYKKYGYHSEEVFCFLYSEKNKERYYNNVLKIYKQTVGNLIPEIIITFEFGNCVLKALFPKSLNLVYLGGLWKSVPPDFSVCFDPINSVSYSSLIKFKNEIRKFNITNNQNDKIEYLKEIFKNNIKNTNIAKKEILKAKKKYDKLILLPLQIQGYMFENECDFKSQKEYFEYVIKKVPKNIGIILTGHFCDMSLIEDFIKKNSKVYSNVIIIKELFKHPPQTSLYVLPYIDGMINVCSSLVLKALLCDVKIFSVGKNYNIWCQDFDNIDNIEEKLNCSKDTKNNIIYWYLTHYDVNTKKIKSNKFLYNYLLKMYEQKDHIDFNFFQRIISIDEVIDYYKNICYTKKINVSKQFVGKKILFKIKNIAKNIINKICFKEKICL